jgi:hypothetical protein
MLFETVVDGAIVVIPIAFAASFWVLPWSERALLERGRSGVHHYVERDGALMHKDALRLLDPALSIAGRVLLQLWLDLRGIPSLMFIAGATAFVLDGILGEDAMTLAFGLGIFGVYLWMFVSTVRSFTHAVGVGRFSATLIELRGPTFPGVGRATARLENGRTFEIGVAWRPIEFLRRSGPLELVLVGSVESPEQAIAVGMRRLDVVPHG